MTLPEEAARKLLEKGELRIGYIWRRITKRVDLIQRIKCHTAGEYVEKRKPWKRLPELWGNGSPQESVHQEQTLSGVCETRAGVKRSQIGSRSTENIRWGREANGRTGNNTNNYKKKQKNTNNAQISCDAGHYIYKEDQISINQRRPKDGDARHRAEEHPS